MGGFYNFYCLICGKRFKVMRVDAKTCCVECRVALSQLSRTWSEDNIDDDIQTEIDKKIEIVKTGASPDIVKDILGSKKKKEEKLESESNPEEDND